MIHYYQGGGAMTKIYKSNVMEGINQKAIELANEYDVSVEIAEQAIYAAITDLLITEDTELVSQAVGNLRWLESRLKEG